MLTTVTDNLFRDSSGRRLTDYPRPSVAVDTALLIPDRYKGLLVLEVRRENTTGWGVPGTFLWEGERLADAVRRSLKVKAGVEGVEPHQLQVFDDPTRDDRGWVLSVAHWAVVHPDRLESRLVDATRLMPADKPGRLIYDHRLIVESAVEHLRSRYRADADPDWVLGEQFTMRELWRLHQSVAGRPLDRNVFHRQMTEKGRVERTGEVTEGTRGRPAELFRRQISDAPRNQRLLPRSRFPTTDRSL